MMFEAIFKLLPDWVLPVLASALAWFGFNYLFLTGFIAERSIVKHCAADSRQFCTCVSDVMPSEAKLPLTLWSSTLGFYEAMRDQDVIAARTHGQATCNG